MTDIEQREHERITISMPTRMWLNETRQGKQVEFEGHATTRDLAIGGTFVHCAYLLPVGYPINLEMRINEKEFLVTRGEIVHVIGNSDSNEPGMGIMFTAVDAENRERLLRFFISDRIREFYEQRFTVEFPHLAPVLGLKDVALVLNLWEDREGRLTSLHKIGSEKALKKHRDNEVDATKKRGRR